MELIYFADPMCSWCYGFSPELTKIAAHYRDVPLQIVMGGLRPHGTEIIADMKDFLREHWDHVAERSGQPFTYKILEDTTLTYDTEPSCRAVVVVRHMDPTKEFHFLKSVQYAFYRDNKNTNEVQTFLEIVDEIALDKNTFLDLFSSDAFKAKTMRDFQFSAQLGVRGYPTLLMKNDEGYHTLSMGYQTSEKILRRIENILTEND
ncbi:MAG: DsbA family protein [Saprospiraceae bacterium]|nr:DsbA family protein [Saprospiraceae bacterium]